MKYEETSKVSAALHRFQCGDSSAVRGMVNFLIPRVIEDETLRQGLASSNRRRGFERRPAAGAHVGPARRAGPAAVRGMVNFLIPQVIDDETLRQGLGIIE